MLAGIEVGGTKIVCSVATDPVTVLQRTSIATGPANETLAKVTEFLRKASAHAPRIDAIGIGSFGPLDLDPASETFGSITRTPKPGWSGVNIRTTLATALRCPVAIDTDVNASGLAEAKLGAGKGLASMAYVTVGTGIGGGLIIDGRPMHGLTHPEMGHIRPRRHAEDSDFAGICPFHGDCLEGVASGAAIFARMGRNLADVPADASAWRIIGDYIGQLCANLVLTCSPERIVLGGGVMASNPRLFDYIRPATRTWLGGYVQSAQIVEEIEAFIVPPALNEHSGIVGALMMAQTLAHSAD